MSWKIPIDCVHCIFDTKKKKKANTSTMKIVIYTSDTNF